MKSAEKRQSPVSYAAEIHLTAVATAAVSSLAAVGNPVSRNSLHADSRPDRVSNSTDTQQRHRTPQHVAAAAPHAPTDAETLARARPPHTSCNRSCHCLPVSPHVPHASYSILQRQLVSVPTSRPIKRSKRWQHAHLRRVVVLDSQRQRPHLQNSSRRILESEGQKFL